MQMIYNNRNSNQSLSQKSLKKEKAGKKVIILEDVIPKEPNKIPEENINICFVGGVSTGKSTILNAIFCEKLTQCKIKRTTMVPSVYVETANPFDMELNTTEIFDMIAQKNEEIISKSEKLTLEDCSELIFNVGKLDINILQDSYVNVYDIPGLNDARTKDVYYKYLESKFYMFNLVILLVDIQSGLNTSDEIDIVNFITTHTREQLEHNNRKIYTMVVVNKADDMQLQEEADGDYKLVLTGEMNEMFEQVENTIMEEFRKKSVDEQLIGIIPLCAIDAYLYRMIKKHGAAFKLSQQEILKIGVNEEGKKFAKKNPEQQERAVYQKLKEVGFIDDMIKLSGFSCFEKMLHQFLNKNDTGKKIRIDNLLYKLRSLPKLSEAMMMDMGWFHMDLLTAYIVDYKTIYESIKQIDINIYNERIINMLEEIESMLRKLVSRWGDNYGQTIYTLIAAYENFADVIMLRYFVGYYNEEYPKYLTDKIMSMILYQCDKMIDSSDIVNIFNAMKKLDMFNTSSICSVLNRIMKNMFQEKAITFQDESMDAFIELMGDIDKRGVGISKFLRFCILNQLISNNYDDNTIIRKMMIYKRYGEVPIYEYLHSYYNKLNFSFITIVHGLDANVECMKDFKLDLYYLKYEIDRDSHNKQSYHNMFENK
jgi:GTP-binding protein EngB required for normal cell division